MSPTCFQSSFASIETVQNRIFNAGKTGGGSESGKRTRAETFNFPRDSCASGRKTCNFLLPRRKACCLVCGYSGSPIYTPEPPPSSGSLQQAILYEASKTTQIVKTALDDAGYCHAQRPYRTALNTKNSGKPPERRSEAGWLWAIPTIPFCNTVRVNQKGSGKDSFL
jgi:hypothetical protein